MSLLDWWLRRLGIFRFGAEASVYRTAKDRPISLQMTGSECSTGGLFY